MDTYNPCTSPHRKTRTAVDDFESVINALNTAVNALESLVDALETVLEDHCGRSEEQIPKDDAQTCTFTAEVLQKHKYRFPRSMGTPKKSERHAAWERHFQ